MRLNLLASLSLALMILTSSNGQTTSSSSSGGGGALSINVPSTMLTCEAVSVQWVFTGSASDAASRTVSIAVEAVNGNGRRSLVESSPVRFIRKRADSIRSLHMRRAVINIAGGSSLPLTQESWTWNSVGVPPGDYRMALVVEPDSVVFYSDTFLVTQGPDVSCLGSLLSSTTAPASDSSAPTSTAAAIETTDAPSSNFITSQDASATPEPTLSNSGASSTGTTPPSSSTEASAQSNSVKETSGGGPSKGGIAAAVIIPLLVLGVLIYLFCMRRQKAQDNQSSSSTSHVWREKFQGFFNGSGSAQHRRHISEPLHPVHAAGLAMHEHAIQSQMHRLADTDEKTASHSQDNGTDFRSASQEQDAHLVTPERVDAMVRASMEAPDRQAFYQQGSNEALRQSMIAAQRRETISTLSDGNSTLPTYLRDADFTSQHTHSSFGHEVDGAAVANSSNAVSLERSPSGKGGSLERSNSKIRRKPVPTYSSYSEKGAGFSSVSLPLADDIQGEGQGPFSDEHEVVEQPQGRNSRHISNATASTVLVPDAHLQYMLSGADQEIMMDSPTLPHAETPVTMSRSFPVSVCADSPSQRILLDAPRDSLTEEQRTQLHKLSIHMPAEERGFRVSF